MSLDVFRGGTIAAMMLVNNPGTWDHIYAPLDRAEWHGWTFTDLIFPFFLWIVGVAIPLSMSKRLEAGEPQMQMIWRITRWSLILIVLGLVLNAISYWFFDKARIPGVLQRIGVCYFFAGLIFLRTKIIGQIVATVVLLAGYWLVMAFYPVPNFVTGNYTDFGNFSAYLDGLVLNRWTAGGKTWDPEGIFSTIPAIASVLFGVLTGHLLRARKSMEEKTAWLFVAGNILLFVGSLMNMSLPINKKIWTSSYAVFMAGMAMNVFAVCYWLVDVKEHRKWVKPLAIYGMNAITVFFVTGLLGRIILKVQVHGVTLQKWVYDTVFFPLTADPRNSSLLHAIAWTLMMYGVAWVMYRKKWFVKF